MNPLLINIVAAEIPDIMKLIRSAFAKANPGVPVPTSDEILALFDSTVIVSLAKDDVILARLDAADAAAVAALAASLPPAA